MLQLIVFLRNRLPTIEIGCRNGIHRQRLAPQTYEQAKDVLINNTVVTRFYIHMNHNMVFKYVLRLWVRTKSMTTKKARQTLVISIAMRRMWHCNAGRIARWSTSSRASLEATGCRYRASARIASPQRPPWSTILVKNTKHYQKTIFSQLTYGRPKPKAMRIS